MLLNISNNEEKIVRCKSGHGKAGYRFEIFSLVQVAGCRFLSNFLSDSDLKGASAQRRAHK